MGMLRRRQERVGRIVHQLFGYDQLRPGQEAALKSVMEGYDTLVVMPTGAGKSMIYQAAGNLRPGPTIVISPLIALQFDQVESIEERNVGPAAVVNSMMKPCETHDVFERLCNGNIEFLFLAPEQFNHEETLTYIRDARPSLFVVDEAHCISEWGHDFRPEYLRLGAVIDELDHPCVLAMTATASLPVRKEIIERLHLQDPHVVIRGFDRPNIWLGVERFQDGYEKQRALVEYVKGEKKPGIVYVATRKHAEDVATALNAAAVHANFYHAGMKSQERKDVQQAFMEDGVEVIVATTAFGMGVDKANVRFVFHYDISDSIDSYYQEFGRAGRDGQQSRSMMFYLPKDLGVQQFLASSGHIEADQVEMVAETIQQHKGAVSLRELGEELNLSQTKLMQVLGNLEEIGVIKTLPDGDVFLEEEVIDLDMVADEVVQMQETRRQFERSRIEMIRGYAETITCRRAYLLSYFGEPYEGPCGFCDNCEAGLTTAMEVAKEADNRLFPLNSKVTHKMWGEGIVLRYEDNKIVVLFDVVGYKMLSLEVVREKGLLAPAEN